MITTALLCSLVAFADPPAMNDIETAGGKPYRIHMAICYEPASRFPENVRAGIRREIFNSSQRYFGKAWEIEISDGPADLAQSAEPTLAQLKLDPAKIDKLFWIRIGATGRDWTTPVDASEFPLAVREFDTKYDSWSSDRVFSVTPDQRLPNKVFLAIHQQFRARVYAGFQEVKKDNRSVTMVQGIDLQPVASEYSIVEPGAPFRMYIENWVLKENVVQIKPYKFTYLLYRKPLKEGLSSRSDIKSAMSGGRPLQGRRGMRQQVSGLAASMSDNPSTMVEFTRRAGGKDKQLKPADGFEVLVQPQDAESLISIGNTDHRGRINITPMTLDPKEKNVIRDRPRVLQVILRNGPLILGAFPLVPGEVEEYKVTVLADAFVADVNAKNILLQEQILDTVIQRTVKRKRLEMRKKQFEDHQGKYPKFKRDMTRKQEKDLIAEWKKKEDEIDEAGRNLAKEYNALPKIDDFKGKLKSLTEYAEKNKKTKTLPASIKRPLLQTERLLLPDSFGLAVVEWSVVRPNRNKKPGDQQKEEDEDDAPPPAKDGEKK